jgi:hypothetical protein
MVLQFLENLSQLPPSQLQTGIPELAGAKPEKIDSPSFRIQKRSGQQFVRSAAYADFL